jgi:hypothetical protein
MRQKLFILGILIALFGFSSQAQQRIHAIKLSSGGEVEKFVIEIGESVILNLSKSGELLDWGVDPYIGYGENYQNRMEPYTGKVMYYGPNDDSAYRGKIRYIGRTMITYYASFEYENLRGKIKSIGNLGFDYYMHYDDEAYRGAIKTIGRQQVAWYSSFDNKGSKGKLKSIGNTPLTYYSSFDDKAFQGKVKSIDRNVFTYYSSFDRNEYRGGYKTGNPISIVNGIKFTIGY